MKTTIQDNYIHLYGPLQHDIDNEGNGKWCRSTTLARAYNYVGVYPHLDSGSIPNEKNLDPLHIWYCNVDGFLANIIGNATVNTIGQYSQKHEFFGVEANINWKKCPRRVNCKYFLALKMQSVPPTTLMKIGAKKQGSTFGLAFGQLASKVHDEGSDDLG
jgi:hypothetical protein